MVSGCNTRQALPLWCATRGCSVKKFNKVKLSFFFLNQWHKYARRSSLRYSRPLLHLKYAQDLITFTHCQQLKVRLEQDVQNTFWRTIINTPNLWKKEKKKAADNYWEIRGYNLRLDSGPIKRSPALSNRICMAEHRSNTAGKWPHVLPIVQRQPLNANHSPINNSGSAASFVSDVLTVQRVWRGGGLYLVKTTEGVWGGGSEVC